MLTYKIKISGVNPRNGNQTPAAHNLSSTGLNHACIHVHSNVSRSFFNKIGAGTN